MPLVVLAFFLLPLAAALLAGRVFCGGVCPLGAVQDIVLLRPVEVPRRVDQFLGLFKYAYLIAAIGFAMQPAESRDFIICRFDPFVGMFRLNGPAWLLATGGGLLLLGTVVGRPYCRYLCPYGGLLAIVSRFAIWPVSITPDDELDCGLCVDSCPFGAIRELRAVPSKCFACARCFAHCPRQQLAWGDIELIELDDVIATARQQDSRVEEGAS
ncbi:MAG: 4Fe-4S binding protein [Planctomycetales bacterium]|nr:4Fe-4S binding protein [Planctomycetales bacterium]